MRYIRAICFCLLISIFAVDATAQEPADSTGTTIITVSPFGFVTGIYQKLRFDIERSVGKYASLGIDTRWYYKNAYPGILLSPYVKLFPFKSAPTGFYLYGKGIAGAVRNLRPDRFRFYPAAGVAGGLGGAMMFGKAKNMVIDIHGGIRLISNASDITFFGYSAGRYDDLFLVGPFSFIDWKLGIGYLIR